MYAQHVRVRHRTSINVFADGPHTRVRDAAAGSGEREVGRTAGHGSHPLVPQAA